MVILLSVVLKGLPWCHLISILVATGGHVGNLDDLVLNLSFHQEILQRFAYPVSLGDIVFLLFVEFTLDI